MVVGIALEPQVHHELRTDVLFDPEVGSTDLDVRFRPIKTGGLGLFLA